MTYDQAKRTEQARYDEAGGRHPDGKKMSKRPDTKARTRYGAPACLVIDSYVCLNPPVYVHVIREGLCIQLWMHADACHKRALFPNQSRRRP